MRKLGFILFLLLIAVGVYLFSQFLSLSSKKTFGQARLVDSKNIVIIYDKSYGIEEV
jgi:hypothetical protein